LAQEAREFLQRDVAFQGVIAALNEAERNKTYN